jgi:quercetin dioxygenase-like cupin family protein
MPLLMIALAAAAVNWADAAPVPGRCAEPAADNAGKPGCFLTVEMPMDNPPPSLWWHIYEFGTLADAKRAAGAHGAGAAASSSHGRAWVYVLGDAEESVSGGTRKAVIGPLALPAGRPVTARFMESSFTPGMRTRIHSHPGPEAFYVLEGEQCMETPEERRKLGPGETFVVPPGPHVQAAPKGRKNILLVLYPREAPWMTMEPRWTPSQFCAD